MLTKERHELILRLLRQNKIVSIHDIVDLTKYSEATIRRDFARMESAGLIQRVYGGAELAGVASTGNKLNENISFAMRKSLLSEKKRLIAKKAVSLCQDGETIIIDGGSTTYYMTEFLKGTNLEIITNSFAIAEYLIKNSENRVIIIGGLIYPESQLTIDPFHDNMLKNYYATKTFMGIEGLDENGATNTDTRIIQVEQAMIKQARELIILADSSKFEKQGNIMLCGYDKIHAVITDSDIKDPQRQMILSHDVRLIIA